MVLSLQLGLGDGILWNAFQDGILVDPLLKPGALILRPGISRAGVDREHVGDGGELKKSVAVRGSVFGP